MVIPSYNSERTIQQAIDSALSQTYKGLEIIVVDDCSTDNTISIVESYAKRYPCVRLIRNEKNCGAAIARQTGVNAARGVWIAFLDSDDIWNSEKLEKQISIQRKNNALLVFTGASFIDAEGRPFHWTLHVPERICYKQLLKQNLISNSSVLIQKAVYQRYSVARNDLHEDYCCWLNFLREGNTAYGIDEPLLTYRISPTSKSGNKLKAAKMNWKTYRSIGLNHMQGLYYMFFYTINGLMKYGKLK